jgi:hypothetical protein
MKSSCFFQKLMVALLAAAVLAVIPASAQTLPLPLNGPYGMALDAAGNLYVANQNANQILIYSPGYKQNTARTITQSVSFPSGVAVDPWGNVFVANYGGSYISFYFPDGTQDNSQTITNGILGPSAITTDGLGNVWVNNSGLNVTIYGSVTDGYARPLITTLTAGYPMLGLAVGPTSYFGRIPIPAWAVGTTGAALVGYVDTYLEGSNGYNIVGDFGTAVQVAFGNTLYSSGLFIATSDGTVHERSSNFSVKLAHSAAGMVVDSVRGRIYISDNAANRIYVYNSISGALLHTIK